eukprot:8994286-Alexandrium_andersonii.AAC.1
MAAAPLPTSFLPTASRWWPARALGCVSWWRSSGLHSDGRGLGGPWKCQWDSTVRRHRLPDLV